MANKAAFTTDPVLRQKEVHRVCKCQIAERRGWQPQHDSNYADHQVEPTQLQSLESSVAHSLGISVKMNEKSGQRRSLSEHRPNLY